MIKDTYIQHPFIPKLEIIREKSIWYWRKSFFIYYKPFEYGAYCAVYQGTDNSQYPYEFADSLEECVTKLEEKYFPVERTRHNGDLI